MWLNPNKLIFEVKTLNFMGNYLTERGIKVSTNRFKDVINMVAPKNKSGIQRMNVIMTSMTYSSKNNF